MMFFVFFIFIYHDWYFSSHEAGSPARPETVGNTFVITDWGDSSYEPRTPNMNAKENNYNWNKIKQNMVMSMDDDEMNQS